MLGQRIKRNLWIDRLGSVSKLCALVTIGAIVWMLGAGTANAQLPEICVQYPDLPVCELPDNGGGGPNGNNFFPPGGEPGSNSLGETLPFTGYPLTPLLLLMLLLLILAALSRAYAEIQERRQTRTVGTDAPGFNRQ